MIGKLINKISRKFGVKISRVKKNKTMAFKEHNKPLFNEFIGVSGVGKTTLYRKLDFKKLGAVTITDFLRITNKNTDDTLFDDKEVYQKLAETKLEVINEKNVLALDKYRYISWFRSVIIQDLAVINNIFKHIVISDEGLVHNFNSELMKLYEANISEFKKLLKNRAFIYCFSDPQLIAEQILNRYKETGKLVPQHKNRTFEDLVFAQNKTMQSRENLISILEKENVPVLRINTSENDEDNVRKIYRFVSKLQQD